MIEKCNSGNSITILTIYGKELMLLSKVYYISSNLRISIVSDSEGNKHRCTDTITEICEQHTTSGLYISSRSILINANHIEIDSTGKINYYFITLDDKDKSVHYLSRLNRSAAKRENKLLKHPTLRDYLLRHQNH